MTPSRYGEPMRIGEVLKSARTRQGMDIRTVEERTKIRTKYLRALESEDWEVLPSPAYAKGFLRTYAQLLGLDADAVVDEFRRQVESKLDASHPLRLERAGARGPPAAVGSGPRGPGPWALVALGVVAAVGILLVVGLIGGDEDRRLGERRQEGRGKQDERKDGGERNSRGRQARAGGRPRAAAALGRERGAGLPARAAPARC